MENGILTYLNEAAYGDMRALLKDIGMNRDSIRFYNIGDIRKLSENQLHETDDNFKYLMNALFTPVDMTDHEEDFVGWDELPGALPINNISWLSPLQDERMPQTDRLAAIETVEARPIRATSPTLQGMLEGMAADIEVEDDLAYGAEDGEEDYGEEYGGEDYGEEGAEEILDDPEFGVVKPAGMKTDDRFFLSVKPYRQWQDKSTYHYKLGIHDYEDDSQELDPDFHLLSEFERDQAERSKT
jgi:hypothetical protein